MYVCILNMSNNVLNDSDFSFRITKKSVNLNKCSGRSLILNY